jgi:hypothetical protein
MSKSGEFGLGGEQITKCIGFFAKTGQVYVYLRIGQWENADSLIEGQTQRESLVLLAAAADNQRGSCLILLVLVIRRKSLNTGNTGLGCNFI